MDDPAVSVLEPQSVLRRGQGVKFHDSLVILHEQMLDDELSPVGQNLAELREGPGQEKLKVTSQNVANTVKREVEQLRQDFGQLALAGSVLKNARSARQFASSIIDAAEKIGNRFVQFDEKMAEVASGTPLAPLLRMQAGLRRRIVEGSSRLARSLWRSGSAPHGEQT